MADQKHVLLTERDMKLFRWINSHRYVQAMQIFKRLGVSEKFYRRLGQLVSAGWLIHESIFRGYPGHYRCTKNATDISGDELPPTREVSLATYKHDMLLVDLALELECRVAGRWITERKLRQGTGGEKGLRTWSAHFPDGIIELASGQRIAIEVEYTNWKTTSRLKKIIESYRNGTGAVKDISGVMYYCNSATVMKKVTNAVEQAGAGKLIKVHMLNEVLPERSAENGTAKR